MSQPIKGLHTDFQPINQPDNTLRFALNSLNDSLDGGLGSVISEHGNELCVSLDTEVIGIIAIADNEFAVFSVAAEYSEIGLLKNCNYTIVVQSNCLNFSKDYPIKGVARVRNCDRIVYWNDCNNPDRQFNFDNQDEYIKSDFSLTDISNSKWDCEKFELIPSFSPISVEVQNSTFASSLDKGSYAFAFAYEDPDGNRTDFFSFTDAILIEDNESVVLNLSNIDEDFAFIRPAVIVFTTDNVTNTVYLLDTILVSSDTAQFTFTAVSEIATSLAKINIQTSRFKISKAMDIVNKRLVRGNLQEDLIDWTVFQTAVNQASVRWIAEPEEVDLSQSAGQQNIVNRKSLRRDEIYDIGLVFAFDDGSESPVFSIPGRKTITDVGLINLGNINEDIRTDTLGANWDTTDVAVVAHTLGTGVGDDEVSEYDVAHLGLGVGATIPRWQIYNTAIRDTYFQDTNKGFLEVSGIPGYYEDENQQYPASFGTTLEGSNVRYHRMPTLAMCPVHFKTKALTGNQVGLDNKQFIFHLGVEVLDVVFPTEYADRLVGYKIVYSKIDNPTVLDTGILERVTELIDGANQFITPSVPFHLSNDDTYVESNDNGIAVTNSLTGFISPLDKFSGLVEGNYLSPQLHLNGVVNTIVSGASPTAPDFGDDRYIGTLIGDNPLRQSTYRRILDQKSLGINTVSFFNNYSVLNNGKQEYDLIEFNARPYYDTAGTFNFTTVVPSSTGYALTQIKSNTVPLSNRYTTRFISFNGQLYTEQNQHVFGGDTYIVDFAYRKTQRELLDEEMPNSATAADLDDVTCILRFFTECSINTNHREEGTGSFTASDGKVQPADLFWPGTLPYTEFLKREPEYRNYYELPGSYSVTNFWKEYSVLPASYDFSDECNVYRTLLAYSEQSQPTDLADNYRTFRINNLALIEENRGEISNIVFFREKLLVFTDQSLFQLIPNPQQIETDLSSIYIGTAEFLSIPAREMIQAEWGHAGTSGRFNIKQTPYGLFWIDIEQGKVYKFYDGLEDISADGMHNFFQRNRDFKVSEEYEQQFNAEYPNEDNTLIPAGVGIRSVYDPNFERFLLTKIDKEPLYPLNFIEYCVPYLVSAFGDTFFSSNYTEFSGNPFPHSISGLNITPPGLYDMFSTNVSPYDSTTGFNNNLNLEYGRVYPHLHMSNPFTVSPPFASGPSVSYTDVFNSVDWLNANTEIQFGFANFFKANANGTYSTNGFEVGDFTGHKPYILFQDIVGYTGDPSPLSQSQRQYLGFFYSVELLGLTLYTPQIDPDALTSGFGNVVSILSAYQTIAQLTADSDPLPLVGLFSPPVTESIVRNPFTDNVVDYTVNTNLGLLANPNRSFGWVWPNERRHILGFNTPDTDTWTLTSGLQILSLANNQTPNVYISINNGSQIINGTTTLVNSAAFGDTFEVQFNTNIVLNQGDEIDLIIDNSRGPEQVDYEDMFLIAGFTGIRILSTTDLERVICKYGSPEDIFEVGVYDNFNIEGYSTTATSADQKISHLEDSLYWVEFFSDNETVTITAGNTANVSSATGIVSETGVYELYTNDFVLEFTTENHGASNYTITLDYEGTTLATFDYEPTLSAINGYDTFKAVWSGVTHLTMIAGSTWPEINVTVNLTDLTSANVNSSYSAYSRLSNAVQTIKYDVCDSFLIKTYDTLTSIAEASLLAFGADYVVSVTGTEERLLNYVVVPEDGLYDIEINNDYDPTDPNVVFTLSINDVNQSPLYTARADGTGFSMSLKDVTLTAGDVIKVTTKESFHNPSIFSDEYLTSLVKKDYTCIETLPFDEKSYTVSYDVKNGQWASFHSYLPKFEFNDSKFYYTTENLTDIYKHVTDNYLTFYGNLYPHVLEFVVQAPITTILNSIKWVGDVQQYNDNYWIDVEEVSFDQMLIRNSRQSTGVQTLDFNQSSIFWDNTIKKIIKRNREYRVGGIRNLSTGQPLVTEEGTLRSVDILSNDSVIDTNRPLHQQDPLRDKFHIIRLYYNPTTSDMRIITNIVDTLKQYSFG